MSYFPNASNVNITSATFTSLNSGTLLNNANSDNMSDSYNASSSAAYNSHNASVGMRNDRPPLQRNYAPPPGPPPLGPSHATPPGSYGYGGPAVYPSPSQMSTRGPSGGTYGSHNTSNEVHQGSFNDNSRTYGAFPYDDHGPNPRQQRPGNMNASGEPRMPGDHDDLKSRPSNATAASSKNPGYGRAPDGGPSQRPASMYQMDVPPPRDHGPMPRQQHPGNMNPSGEPWTQADNNDFMGRPSNPRAVTNQNPSYRDAPDGDPPQRLASMYQTGALPPGDRRLDMRRQGPGNLNASGEPRIEDDNADFVSGRSRNLRPAGSRNPPYSDPSQSLPAWPAGGQRETAFGPGGAQALDIPNTRMRTAGGASMSAQISPMSPESQRHFKTSFMDLKEFEEDSGDSETEADSRMPGGGTSRLSAGMASMSLNDSGPLRGQRTKPAPTPQFPQRDHWDEEVSGQPQTVRPRKERSAASADSVPKNRNKKGAPNGSEEGTSRDNYPNYPGYGGALAPQAAYSGYPPHPPLGQHAPRPNDSVPARMQRIKSVSALQECDEDEETGGQLQPGHPRAARSAAPADSVPKNQRRARGVDEEGTSRDDPSQVYQGIPNYSARPGASAPQGAYGPYTAQPPLGQPAPRLNDGGPSRMQRTNSAPTPQDAQIYEDQETGGHPHIRHPGAARNAASDDVVPQRKKKVRVPGGEEQGNSRDNQSQAGYQGHSNYPGHPAAAAPQVPYGAYVQHPPPQGQYGSGTPQYDPYFQQSYPGGNNYGQPHSAYPSYPAPGYTPPQMGYEGSGNVHSVRMESTFNNNSQAEYHEGAHDYAAEEYGGERERDRNYKGKIPGTRKTTWNKDARPPGAVD